MTKLTCVLAAVDGWGRAIVTPVTAANAETTVETSGDSVPGICELFPSFPGCPR